MFGASILALSRLSDRKLRQVVVNGLTGALIDSGDSAILSALGGQRSLFGGFYRGALRGMAEEAQQMQKEHDIWRRADKKANPWRYNWQSQPRVWAGVPEGGEWRRGRLDYPAWPKAAVSRGQLRKRRAHQRWVKENKKHQAAYKARREALSHWKAN